MNQLDMIQILMVTLLILGVDLILELLSLYTKKLLDRTAVIKNVITTFTVGLAISILHWILHGSANEIESHILLVILIPPYLTRIINYLKDLGEPDFDDKK